MFQHSHFEARSQESFDVTITNRAHNLFTYRMFSQMLYTTEKATHGNVGA